MKILNRILLSTAFCAASCTISLAQTASPDTYLADFYARFVSVLEAGGDLNGYMAQVNHPNAAGHQVAVGEIARWIAGE